MRKQAIYDATHTRHISLKLNLSTDADIISYLEGKAAQTEIKRLIRQSLPIKQIGSNTKAE